MSGETNFLIELSVLYRNVQKYFDKILQEFDIGSGQLLFLLCVYEQQGITMQDVTRISEVDKGTTTKSIQRLIEQNYIDVVVDENDRRVKRLYPTSRASAIMPKIYEYRVNLRKQLGKQMDFETFEKLLKLVGDNARDMSHTDYETIRIGGIQKLTLLDYPEKVASTIFTSGCNFKCPFCHNKELVFVPENATLLDPDETLRYLNSRKGKIDGVCISGGEPLIQENLIPYMREIHQLGYRVKLDTNGYESKKLAQVLLSGYVDYVAMDIKNCKKRYGETIGLNEEYINLDMIDESIHLLAKGKVDYEFRTTICKELHILDDLLEIAKWLPKESKWYLQQYEESDDVIQKGFTPYSAKEMETFQKELLKIKPNVYLRGIREV